MKFQNYTRLNKGNSMTTQNITPWVQDLKLSVPSIVDKPCDASVLIVLREHSGRLQVLLTQRSANMRHHANEWSLPGGKTEQGETSFETALRESNEEIGLQSECVENIGQLQNFKSKDSLDVSVCISVLTNENFESVLNEDEVQQVIWFDLHHISQKPDRTHKFERNGQSILVPFYDVLEPSLWGLTAMILQALIKSINHQINSKPHLQTLLSNK